jgi:hypothetical protein
MNPKQKTSVAKYFYDISKGFIITGILLGVPELFKPDDDIKWAILCLVGGLSGSVIFFILAYKLDGGGKASKGKEEQN